MSFGNGLAQDLLGVGMPPELGSRIGASVLTTIAGAGTAQTGGAAIPNGVTNVLATTGASDTAFVLPSTAELEVVYMVVNSSATTAVVYPPTSGTINAAAGDASVSIAQNLARIFIRKSTNRWISFLAA